MMTFVRGPSTFTGEGQIYVKLLPDGDPVQLTHDDLVKMAPRFAPDGSRIAYSTLGLSGWEVWTVPVLGGQQPRRLLSNAEGLRWIEEPTQTGGTSPRVLFSELTGKGITMAVVSSTESRANQRQVFVRDEIMAHFSYLSPDRTQLLLAEMGFSGWLPCRLAPYDGSSLGKPVGPDPSQCTSAAWSPDGRWMYFSANTGGGFHIWRQRFPDGTPEQVTFGATEEEEGVEVTPDGRSFLTSIGTRQNTLWIHDSGGDRQVTSDAYAFQPLFSPDGKKLYYLVRIGTGGVHQIIGNLWVMDLESDTRQRLLPDYSIEHYSVSQDGQRIVFVATGDARQAGVWVAALDGRSSPRRVASRGTQAFFGAEGDVVFGTQEGAGSFIYRVREDGTNVRKAIADSVHYGPYAVSPDGSHVVAWMQGSTEETANSVVVFPLDGSAPTRVCGTCAGRDSEFPQPVSWSADGKFVYLGFWINGAFAVPLRSGTMLPPLPASGIRSIQDAAALPGAQQFPVPGAFAGSNPGVYAYSKTSAQRNIYRVPVP
jgi:Tol biopolymer transport system component